VALGHVHRHQVLGNLPLTVYAGSLERIDFGEEKEDKGFVVVQLEKGSAEFDFHKVDARRFLTVEVDIRTDDPMPEILSALEKQNLAGVIVRVFIRTSQEREARIQYNEIRRYLVSRDVAHVAAIAKQVERKHRTVFSGRLAEEMTPLQALDLYLKNKQVPAERANVLIRYADAMVQDLVQRGQT
jgi:exonuclease SbcD